MDMVMKPTVVAYKSTEGNKGVGIAFHNVIIDQNCCPIKLEETTLCKSISVKPTFEVIYKMNELVKCFDEESFDRAFGKCKDLCESKECIEDFITTFSIKTNVGIITSDYEKKEDVGYDAMYLSVMLNGTDEMVDIASVKVTEDKKIKLDSYFNLKHDYPDRTVEYSQEEIDRIFLRDTTNNEGK